MTTLDTKTLELAAADMAFLHDMMEERAEATGEAVRVRIDGGRATRADILLYWNEDAALFTRIETRLNDDVRVFEAPCFDPAAAESLDRGQAAAGEVWAAAGGPGTDVVQTLTNGVKRGRIALDKPIKKRKEVTA